MVPRTFLFIFHAGSRRLGVLIIFGTQFVKKKRPVRPVFPDYLSVSYDYDAIYNEIRNNLVILPAQSYDE